MVENQAGSHRRKDDNMRVDSRSLHGKAGQAQEKEIVMWRPEGDKWQPEKILNDEWWEGSDGLDSVDTALSALESGADAMLEAVVALLRERAESMAAKPFITDYAYQELRNIAYLLERKK